MKNELIFPYAQNQKLDKIQKSLLQYQQNKTK